MKKFEPKQYFSFEGEVPSDKSVTHRAIMLLSVAEGKSVIENPLWSFDTAATADCMEKLGAQIQKDGEILRISPILKANDHAELYADNSGTTMRLLCGLAGGMGVHARIAGDASLSRRPMSRVTRLLERLGAKITTQNGCAPLEIFPSPAIGGTVNMEVASAQVKSAMLLYGLNCQSPVTVTFDCVTRDHTERMLRGLGADITEKEGSVTVAKSRLKARDIRVCGDISAAAFLLALGALRGEVRLQNVGVNPTRAGILGVLKEMGAQVVRSNEREVCGEPVCDLEIKRCALRPVSLSGGIIANIIDELPILAVLMAAANGKSRVSGAGELRVKESDRIRLICRNLAGLGVKVSELPDGFEIEGEGGISGNADFICQCNGDHRIAMSMAIAALASERGGCIDDEACCGVSFPGFTEIIGA